jgi:hypothetical protein
MSDLPLIAILSSHGVGVALLRVVRETSTKYVLGEKIKFIGQFEPYIPRNRQVRKDRGVIVDDEAHFDKVVAANKRLRQSLTDIRATAEDKKMKAYARFNEECQNHD